MSSTVGSFASRLGPQLSANTRNYRTRCRYWEAPCSREKLVLQCPKIVIKSPWFNEECCHNPCPNILPRFDDMYYKPSDKLCRKYPQTWVECPELAVVKRVRCCNEATDVHPMETRPRKVRRPSSCELLCNPMPCPRLPSEKFCPRLRTPGCLAKTWCVGRIPPNCKSGRKPVNCKKSCAPYPSYSECSRDLPKRESLSTLACKCLDPASRCLANRAMMRIPYADELTRVLQS